jgi:transposase
MLSNVSLHFSDRIRTALDRLVEVISTMARRRRWTVENTVAVLEEASQPRASITAVAVADRHEYRGNLLSVAQAGTRGLMPGVTLTGGAQSRFFAARVAEAQTAASTGCPSDELIRLIDSTLCNGRVVRVEENVDPATLARVIVLDASGA